MSLPMAVQFLSQSDIKVGQWYRGRRFMGDAEVNNDRQIKWISQDGSQVRWDSAAVPIGKRHPTVSIEKFLQWARRECTPAEIQKGTA